MNTRIYWRCVTNDQYTAEKCDNRTILDEPQLIEEFRKYFASLIEDKEAFIASVLASLDKQIPEAKNPEHAKQEIEAKRKKLLGKKERYQELYADDLISMAELKDKLADIAESLRALDMDLSQIAQSAEIRSNAEQICRYYREEITRFLDLETVTNMDMRRISDHISVNKDGNVRVVLKKFEEIAV